VYKINVYLVCLAERFVLASEHFVFDYVNALPAWRSFFKEAYAQPHRHFHTMEHVYSIADQINSPDTQMFTECVRTAMYWAALFHDVVYDPRRNDNEEASVALMQQMSKENDAYVPAYLQDLVTELEAC